MLVNMSIIVRNKSCNNLKKSSSEIGYYSYTRPLCIMREKRTEINKNNFIK